MKRLAWVVLGLHVDLRRRIGKVEAQRGGEGGAEGCRLLLILLIQVLRGDEGNCSNFQGNTFQVEYCAIVPALVTDDFDKNTCWRASLLITFWCLCSMVGA